MEPPSMEREMSFITTSNQLHCRERRPTPEQKRSPSKIAATMAKAMERVL
jgi:hypothetical protein